MIGLKKIVVIFALFSMLTLTGCTDNSSISTETQNHSSSVSTEIQNHSGSASSSGRYIANRNSGKLHDGSKCDSLPHEENRIYFSSIEEAHKAGYTDHHKECMGN